MVTTARRGRSVCQVVPVDHELGAFCLPNLTLTFAADARHSLFANAYVLIDAVVQQTMVFIAQLATAGGVGAPLGESKTHCLSGRGRLRTYRDQIMSMPRELRELRERIPETDSIDMCTP